MIQGRAHDPREGAKSEHDPRESALFVKSLTNILAWNIKKCNIIIYIMPTVNIFSKIIVNG